MHLLYHLYFLISIIINLYQLLQLDSHVFYYLTLYYMYYYYNFHYYQNIYSMYQILNLFFFNHFRYLKNHNHFLINLENFIYIQDHYFLIHLYLKIHILYLILIDLLREVSPNFINFDFISFHLVNLYLIIKEVYLYCFSREEVFDQNFYHHYHKSHICFPYFYFLYFLTSYFD